MSYRSLILTTFVLIVGFGASTVAMANPTCQCDVICSRVEERCLNLGGTLDQCADAYDNCFSQCDTWPCGDTSALTQNDSNDLLGLKLPFWMTSKSKLAAHIEAAEKAPENVETTDGPQPNN